MEIQIKKPYFSPSWCW